MATPDDLEEFRACQQGFHGRLLEWSDISRGAKHWIHGPDENARMIGMTPLMCGQKSEDEGLYAVHHRHWANAMSRAVELESRGSK
jgi:benzoate/toluate 1,2-dioxygenase alpha subunit